MSKKVNDVVQKLIFPMLIAIFIQLFTIKSEIGALLAKVEIIEPIASFTHNEQSKRLDIIQWSRQHRRDLEISSKTIPKIVAKK